MDRQLYNTIQPEKCSFAEGDLYKVLTAAGQSFSLYYGYYDERERANPYIEPMPIYPDFLSEPCYTAEGFPFVTKMQDACKHYVGVANGNEECAECIWYRNGEELLGTCACLENRRNNKEDQL